MSNSSRSKVKIALFSYTKVEYIVAQCPHSDNAIKYDADRIKDCDWKGFTLREILWANFRSFLRM